MALFGAFDAFFFAGAGETRRFTFDEGLDLLTGLAARFLEGTVRGLCLAARTFAALRAGAFPAGERLVAGFRRVALPAETRLRDDDDADECREIEREESLLTLLAMGLLMQQSPRF